MKFLDDESKNILLQAGLTARELEIFQLILANGKMTAGEISRAIPSVSRPNVYKVIAELTKKKLIEKTKKGKISAFKIADPYNFRDLIAEKRRKILKIASKLEEILPNILAIYQFTTDRPSVRYYQGIEGIKMIYDELNNSGAKKLLLIRSIYDDNHPELAEMVEKQIKKQVEIGMETQAITPLVKDSERVFKKLDKSRLVTRRIVEVERLALPAQILVWGNTVAIINMKGKIISSVVENKNIAITFRIIFQYIWDSSEDYHQKIIKEW